MSEKKNIEIKEVSAKECYSEIREVMLKAHAASGLEFKNDSMTEEDYFSRLKDGGAVFCAFDGEKIVGTMMIDIEKYNKWYGTDKSSAQRFIAVLPEYAGNGIASRLCIACENWAKENSVDAIFWTTSSKNNAAMATAMKNGFIKVDRMKFKGYDCPSVRMVKWLNSSAFKKIKAGIYFKLKEKKVK